MLRQGMDGPPVPPDPDCRRWGSGAASDQRSNASYPASTGSKQAGMAPRTCRWVGQFGTAAGPVRAVLLQGLALLAALGAGRALRDHWRLARGLRRAQKVRHAVSWHDSWRLARSPRLPCGWRGCRVPAFPYARAQTALTASAKDGDAEDCPACRGGAAAVSQRILALARHPARPAHGIRSRQRLGPRAAKAPYGAQKRRRRGHGTRPRVRWDGGPRAAHSGSLAGCRAKTLVRRGQCRPVTSRRATLGSQIAPFGSPAVASAKANAVPASCGKPWFDAQAQSAAVPCPAGRPKPTRREGRQAPTQGPSGLLWAWHRSVLGHALRDPRTASQAPDAGKRA